MTAVATATICQVDSESVEGQVVIHAVASGSDAIDTNTEGEITSIEVLIRCPEDPGLREGDTLTVSTHFVKRNPNEPTTPVNTVGDAAATAPADAAPSDVAPTDSGAATGDAAALPVADPVATPETPAPTDTPAPSPADAPTPDAVPAETAPAPGDGSGDIPVVTDPADPGAADPAAAAAPAEVPPTS